MSSPGKLINEVGNVHGRLTVIRRDASAKGSPKWICKCICGNTVSVSGKHLRSGKTRSCGCLQRESHRESVAKRNYKHGCCKRKGRTRLHKIWTDMKKRCTNPKNCAYLRYGGRGITFHPAWRDFNNFFNDMNTSYLDHTEKFGIKNTTLERINNDKGYEPGNCCWATRQEQANNTSRAHYITLNGKTLTIAQWSEVTGMKRATIVARLKHNWPVERVLTEPVHVEFGRRAN